MQTINTMTSKIDDIRMSDSMSNRQKFGKLSDLGLSVSEIVEVMNRPGTIRIKTKGAQKVSYAQVYIGIKTRSDIPKEDRKYVYSKKADKTVCVCTEVECICKDNKAKDNKDLAKVVAGLTEDQKIALKALLG